ncbi:hypothetical protein ABIE67_009105 [Streptomyces sp. V4I8]|uniref:sialate O-acetylesterase n=1 Tax=Streptomyces sp. V4I8 TaxID=3156469 RepID=UPI003514A3BA
MKVVLEGHSDVKRKTFPKMLVTFMVAALHCSALSTYAYAKQPDPGYDVVLLAGQSNMVGWGTGRDNPADAAVHPRVFQWHPNRGIIPARDPLVHQGPSNRIGMGITFGKAFAQSLPSNRKVLLVGAAWGGTSVISGLWKPGGKLFNGAVARANSAMAAAGPGARFAGILWHQGESDVINGGAPTYEASLNDIIWTFRSSITGASARTPFIAGEFARTWISSLNGTRLDAARTILDVFHTLPQRVPHTSWVSSAGLRSNATEAVHFSALSQRALGRRYAHALIDLTWCSITDAESTTKERGTTNDTADYGRVRGTIRAMR